MEIYDPHNPEENRELPTRLLTSCPVHTSAVLLDGRVLIAAGCDGSDYPSSTEFFYPVSGKIEPGPFMNEERHEAASAVLNGIVYVCGGYYVNIITYSASCEKFESNKWQPIASMNQMRHAHV